MKRIWRVSVVWLAILAAGLLVLACAAPAAEPSPAPPASPASPAASAPTSEVAGAQATPAPGAPALTKEYNLSMATAGTVGVWYPFAGVLTNVWAEHIPGVTVTPEVTAASVENARPVGSGQVDLGLMQNAIAIYAQDGVEMFQDNQLTNLRALGTLNTEVVHWVTTPEIGGIQDLAGKTFVVGTAGGGTEVQTREIMESNGFTYENLGSSLFMSQGETVAAFKDRKIDGFALTGPMPMSPIVEIGTTMDISLIPFEGEVAQNAINKNPSFVPFTIPAGTYRGIDTDTPTLSLKGMLVAREDLDEELVYWLVKVMVEQQPQIAEGHVMGREITREGLLQGLSIQLHPGAERYYREIGLLN